MDIKIVIEALQRAQDAGIQDVVLCDQKHNNMRDILALEQGSHAWQARLVFDTMLNSWDPQAAACRAKGWTAFEDYHIGSGWCWMAEDPESGELVMERECDQLWPIICETRSYAPVAATMLPFGEPVRDPYEVAARAAGFEAEEDKDGGGWGWSATNPRTKMYYFEATKTELYKAICEEEGITVALLEDDDDIIYEDEE